jgi:hypothetical protein
VRRCHPEPVEGSQRWPFNIKQHLLFSTIMKLALNYFVYIVQCNDGFYYAGITNKLERRINQHNGGKNIFSLPIKEEWLR